MSVFCNVASINQFLGSDYAAMILSVGVSCVSRITDNIK